MSRVTTLPLSSLDKEESLACQITSSSKIKLGCFLNKIKKVVVQNNLFFAGWGSYLASQ